MFCGAGQWQASYRDLVFKLSAAHDGPQFDASLKGHNTHTRERGRQMAVDFLVQATGGPDVYHGLEMRTARLSSVAPDECRLARSDPQWS